MIEMVAEPAESRSATSRYRFSLLKVLSGFPLAWAMHRRWAQGQREEGPKGPPTLHPTAWVPIMLCDTQASPCLGSPHGALRSQP